MAVGLFAVVSLFVVVAGGVVAVVAAGLAVVAVGVVVGVTAVAAKWQSLHLLNHFAYLRCQLTFF